MTILGLGVDIVHLPRIAALITRRGSERFANRVLSHEEIRDWKRESEGSLRYLAVRFSVKEAAYKALYPITRPSWKELTFKSFGGYFPGSKPVLLYEPTMLRERERLGQIHVSVSHDGDFVFSTVIVETP
ncbi:4'-phosphopantetheinyl transferase [Phellopilus nigrolimitatus]|nr:4'-phosphopantetheinyl transferase [Phellopilus nigrolimitatus]